MPLPMPRFLPASSRGRRRLLWLALSAPLLLPFLGAGAFALAPDTVAIDIRPETVVEAIALSAPDSAAAPSDPFFRESVIRPGDTLSSALSRMNVDAAEISALLSSEASRPLSSGLRSGSRLQALASAEGRLLSVRSGRAGAPALAVLRQGDSFVAEQPASSPSETRLAMRSGVIVSSLYGATDAAGIPDSIATSMAEIFSTRMDFREDTRRGDSFSVIYSAEYRDGEPVSPPKLLAAEFVNAGTPHRALLFRDATGRESYYTPEGESLKKGFRRSPLEFSRVTSSFSNSRRHPIFGFHRAHTGVDFGAPSGTRVLAVADAEVEFAGRRGGYGNLLILRHPNGYRTYYAHLKAFASGVRPGRRVEQGEPVAYVGSTGASTGPHLHYEIRVAGKPQNPMAIALPRGEPLAKSQIPQFLLQTRDLASRQADLRGTNLAALD